jgi:Fe-S cluster biogenesis protein NfuA/nitrite reductase/ring-hydroxylating ferredoxin subunit
MSTPEEQEFMRRIGRIDMLVEQIEQFADPAAKEIAQELVQALMDLHGAGLERMLDLTWEQGGETGQAIIDDLARDELVSSLLLLHGLHPLDLETRVVQALDKVRPYLASHGGNVALLGVDDGVVRLSLQGSCNGCASSAVTLKLAIEESIQQFAPDVVELKVEGVVPPPPPPSGFIPLTQIRPKTTPAAMPEGSGWQRVSGLSPAGADGLHVLDVAGSRVLFCRLNNTLYAYNDACTHCGSFLKSAALAGTTLTCPACEYRYDVMRAGRCLDIPDRHLEPFPLLVENGQVKVALPALAAG